MGVIGAQPLAGGELAVVEDRLASAAAPPAQPGQRAFRMVDGDDLVGRAGNGDAAGSGLPVLGGEILPARCDAAEPGTAGLRQDEAPLAAALHQPGGEGRPQLRRIDSKSEVKGGR